MGFLLQSLSSIETKLRIFYIYDLCRSNSNLRRRTPKLNVQSRAINTATPPNKTWLASVLRTMKEKAIPQQPSATMPGRMRLCGPRTPGERNGRLPCTGALPFVVLSVLLRCACEDGALCVLLFAGPFLCLLAFGITLTSPHLVSLRDSLRACPLLFVTDWPSGLASFWFAPT